MYKFNIALTTDHDLIKTLYAWGLNISKSIGKEYSKFQYKSKNKNSITIKYCISPNKWPISDEVWDTITLRILQLEKAFKDQIKKYPILNKNIQIKTNRSVGMSGGKGQMGNVRLVISNNILNDNYDKELNSLTKGENL